MESDVAELTERLASYIQHDKALLERVDSSKNLKDEKMI